MNFKQFHYIMIHDEFGEGGIINNYYILFALIVGFLILITFGVIGWMIYLNQL